MEDEIRRLAYAAAGVSWLDKPSHYVKYRAKNTGRMTSAVAHTESEALHLAQRLRGDLYANVSVVTYDEFWGRT